MNATNECIEIFKKQIDQMINNLENLHKIGNVNLVFEGGSLNGYYLLGVAMFLKELENRQIITVNKVSGTSIGAYVAFHYLNNTLDIIYNHGTKAKEIFKDRLNMSYFKEILDNDLSGCNINNLNNRLFITYYNVLPNQTREIQSIYKSNTELYDVLLASAYIPFFIDGGMYYKMNSRNVSCIDGGTPFIFEKEKDVKILYVKLTSINKLINMISHRGEKDGRGRVCEGIVSAYNFFLYGETGSDMCSWISNWNNYDYIIYKLKYIFCILIMWIICFLILIIKITRDKNTFVSHIIKKCDIIGNCDIESRSILNCLWGKIIDTVKDIIINIIT